MRVRPATPEGLRDAVVERCLAARADRPLRVAVDGAPPARPLDLARAVADELVAQGRPATALDAAGFLRPASLRFEHGRTDPDAYLEDRLDVRALDREVLDPLEPGGTGRFLPSLWDPVRDRATRAAYVAAAPGQVVLVAGELLLGRWLAFDLTVHLHLSPAALLRRLPEDERWVLPAYERYAAETDPSRSADLVARVDDPRHPGLVVERD
ncbi:hypothetical protein EV189_2215 [Motilibacter rhizosphaerae]|uniref:Uridine kinase n=1 Tax=Motilibacter rhizosphaerae TaxID=598652 RepID=A0A4Q7NNJ5_9ACTN|nr:uridine kinase [Motilibacter rhizosphaerae]RZS86799.1 hypothetical protein EV189_2215 [Motilibacter rhizosphaerae]